MSAGNRNSGRDGPPPVKNSRSNNTACASSHQASHSLVPYRTSEFYSSFYGDYFGDSSTIRRVPIMADLPGFASTSQANGMFSTMPICNTGPFAGSQVAPLDNSSYLGGEFTGIGTSGSFGGFTQQSAVSANGLSSTGATASFTNGLSMELENVPHSINVRCSYGEDCLALESPLPWILLRCIFCGKENVHHMCETEGKHRKVLASIGVDSGNEELSSHTCYYCISKKYPQLTFAGGSEVGDGSLEADGERNIGEEARNVGDIGNGSGGGNGGGAAGGAGSVGDDGGGAAGANPFLSVLDDADEPTQPMEGYQFEQAFPHCARNMFSLWLRNNADVHPLGKLISMGSGLTPEELQQPRIDQYIASKWITKSDKKVTNDMLKEEINRRWTLEGEVEETFNSEHPKQQKATNKNAAALIRILSGDNAYGPVLLVLKDVDKMTIKMSINKVLDFVQRCSRALQAESRRVGGHLIQSTKAKMRCVLALLHPHYRSTLLTMFDSDTVHELDSRNSIEHKKATIYDLASEKYAKEEWRPLSIVSDIHPDLSTAVELELTDMGPCDSKNFESTIKNLISQYKKASENFKRSGNGTDNIDDITGKISDDTRYKFCSQMQNSIAVAFFWAMIELEGLENHFSQNMGSHGLARGSAPSTSEVRTLGNSLSGRQTNAAVAWSPRKRLSSD